MEAPSHIFHLFFLMNSLVILGAHGVNIQLYEHTNFTGLVWESNSSGGCNSVPRDKHTYVYSIRTDTCFIAYSSDNCNSYWTEKFMPGDIVLSARQFGRLVQIQSLQTCNEEEGGDQLNIDITRHFYISTVVPAVLESYRNVCSCVNVPHYVQNIEIWSINNHHNEMLAYNEPDCSVNKWNPEFLPAGHSSESRWTVDLQKVYKVTHETYPIQSFGPNPNSTYFQTSCNSSRVVTTDGPKTVESTMESVSDLIAAVNCQGYQVLANEFVQLKTQFDELRGNLETFQSEMLEHFRNFTSQLKLDLHDLYA